MSSDDSVLRNGGSHSGQPSSGGLPGPLRRFADRLAEAGSADAVDMNQVGRVLVELAADEEFFGPLIAQLPSGSPGSRWLIRPGRGPRLVLDERALVRGDVATLVPPRDVHNHGHVAGSGPSPYSLILLGDDMLLSGREEYDPEHGTWRALAPGDPGRDNR